MATGIALFGVWLAYYLYVLAPETLGRLSAPLAGVRRVLEAKYYFDDVYNAFTGESSSAAARRCSGSAWMRA